MIQNLHMHGFPSAHQRCGQLTLASDYMHASYPRQDGSVYVPLCMNMY